MQINLTLSVDEVQGILQVLGQLPTSSGAYPLMMNIKVQAESQMPPPESQEAPPSE